MTYIVAILSFFIPRSFIPNKEQGTYSRIVCDIKLDKQVKHRNILTVGGNRIFCNYDISTPTAKITSVKLLLNSVISTPNVKFTTIDIKRFI